MSAPLLSILNVSKSFNGIPALKQVHFNVQPLECLALVGENGAGKSTLMKILSGVWPYGTYKGEILLEGKPLQLHSTLEGWQKGVSIIHQELCLFPELSVAENLFLNEEFPYNGTPSRKIWSRVRWTSLTQRARELFSKLGFAIEPRTKVRKLSVAERQLVEIARAFHHRCKLLILDEPTSALSQSEVEQLFQIIRRMQNQISFIYISHKLEEVFTVSNRIVVLRDGQSVAELSTSSTSTEEIIRAMVGRPIQLSSRTGGFRNTALALSLKDVSHTNRRGEKVLEKVTFDLHAGEVLGIAGLMGSGRSELLRSVVGILPGTRQGKVLLDGKPMEWETLSEAMDAGVAFVPEDRKKDGLFLDQSVGFNLTISILKQLAGSTGALDLVEENKRVSRLISDLRVKCASSRVPIRWLSGGNQQKVLLAKVLARDPKVLLLDEPTRGIDIGAKEEIYELIRRLADKGLAILLVSSELPEILALSDRVLVLRDGRMAADLPNVSLKQETIMSYAAGV